MTEKIPFIATSEELKDRSVIHITVKDIHSRPTADLYEVLRDEIGDRTMILIRGHNGIQLVNPGYMAFIYFIFNIKTTVDKLLYVHLSQGEEPIESIVESINTIEH